MTIPLFSQRKGNAFDIHICFCPIVLLHPSFALLSTHHIDDSILRCCYLKISPGVLLGHSEAIQKHPALYPFKKSDIKCFGIPSGQFHLNVDDVFQGEIPKHLIVGLVSSKAYNGDYSLNPFNFEHFHCNFAAFYVDGKSVPSAALEPNLSTNNYVSPYLSMVGCVDKDRISPILHLCRNDFEQGYCLFVFNINSSYEKRQ